MTTQIPRMPDGSYMTPKDGIYQPSKLKPENVKDHSLICNVKCHRCNSYLPPHTLARHYNPEDPIHKCPDHNREAMETEAILLMGNAKIDKEDVNERSGSKFLFCWKCSKGTTTMLAEKEDDKWLCPECDSDCVII